MNMKRTIAALCVFSLLAVSGCGSSGPAPESAALPVTADNTTSAAETNIGTPETQISETYEEQTEDDNAAEMPELPPIPDDVSTGKPWMDGSLVGNVTADTETSPAEDYYTWVNKDWLVSTELPEGMDELMPNLLAESREKVKTALESELLSGHDARQAQLLFRAFSDTEARDAAGCDPAKKVIDDIRSISGIDELSAFLLDTERSAGVPTLIRLTCIPDYDEHRWIAKADTSRPTFGASGKTYGMNAENTDHDSEIYKKRSELVKNILTRAGFTEEEAEAAFESRLQLEKEMLKICAEIPEERKAAQMLDMDGIESLVGSFPVRALAETYGYGKVSGFKVSSPDDLIAAGQIYTEEHLDELRNYLICGYAIEAGSWLDSEAFDAWAADYYVYYGDEIFIDPQRNKSIGETAFNLTIKALPTPVGRVYAEAYALEHVKEFITGLAHDAVESHKKNINSCEWLSDTSKKRLTDKLDSVTLNLVYPDNWEDFSGLDLDGLDYYGMRRAVWLHNTKRAAPLAGTEFGPELWIDSSLIGGAGSYTTFTNSFVADACWFENDVSLYEAGEITYEEFLGGFSGYLLFHELGHVLDRGNIYYDAAGNYIEDTLLETADLEEYERRVGKLEKYLDGITIWEGQHIIGEICLNEAQAEHSAMQARLLYASEHEDFDYRTFFETRTKNYAMLRTPEQELKRIMGADRHPTEYIEVNVTFQQFDEFLQTYGIKEGDKMYLAPEDRVLVW